MAHFKRIIISIGFFALPIGLFSQTNFTSSDYTQFLENHENMLFSELSEMYPMKNEYYKGFIGQTSIWEYLYLDTINEKFSLTDDEINKLEQNMFVVSERMDYNSMTGAFADIYYKDLPVFISTDAILQALHKSYDKILKQIELQLMQPNIVLFLSELYNSFPNLINTYSSNNELLNSLKDVDLYVTIANSLIQDTLLPSQMENDTQVSEIWNLIAQEQMVSIPLFTDENRLRNIDFSQFTVRGHYVDDEAVLWGEQISLEPYFRTMMWLGRIDFLLTPPPGPNSWTQAELQRMSISACLLNELISNSGFISLLDQNNSIIDFMVGESDNLTNNEISNIFSEEGISSATQLLDEEVFSDFQLALTETFPEGGQRILSSYFIVDPYSSEPDILPVSYKLSGQRFIIDSYIFSNVVYDRIIFNNEKIFRMMPDPLDAMFVLGNENAIYLLQSEIEQYPYSLQLGALRYLVESYDDEYWQSSLYNSWLGALRKLVSPDNNQNHPLFMKTAAWQQEKINTQLASWSQLRHDNLLYAKQSYTGGAGCSFPFAYVEPYPEFYNNLALFAQKAGVFFSDLNISQNYSALFFNNFKEVMLKLKNISEKELNNESLNAEETDFLANVLYENPGCGPIQGWYPSLFYIPEDFSEINFTIADVHTQPTDEFGNEVGRVLHVGTGDVNLGIFLINSPINNQPTAYVGPVFSYYENITQNFYRLTDEEWTAQVYVGNVPPRPDWVNIYLTNSNGDALPPGRELDNRVYNHVKFPNTNATTHQINIYPNPSQGAIYLTLNLMQSQVITMDVYDSQGRIIFKNAFNSDPGINVQFLNLNSFATGIYYCKIHSKDINEMHKIIISGK